MASYGAFTGNLLGLAQLISLIFVASVIGDLGTYFLAREVSQKVGKFVRRFKWFKNNENKVRNSLKKHYFLFLFLSRFIFTGIGPIVNYLSGFEKLNAKRFVLAAILGEFLYAAGVTSIGYIFKDTWNELLSLINYSAAAIILSLIGIYIAYRLIKHFMQRHSDKKS